MHTIKAKLLCWIKDFTKPSYMYITYHTHGNFHQEKTLSCVNDSIEALPHWPPKGSAIQR